ncbi:MAG: PilT protein domain protein [Mucilaginibacter sp.]|nr:PilT protein domain protein [Mucilaginibacter sp.]
MKDKIFIDTNILVYAYSVTEPLKQSIAQNLISSGPYFISTQVLQELSNILNKKYKISWSEIINLIDECKKNFIVFTNTESTISKACELANIYKYSFYDSLIISAALQNNCTILYSEDMRHRQMIADKLKIINPFI